MKLPQLTKVNVALAIVAVVLGLAYYHHQTPMAELKSLAHQVGIEGFKQHDGHKVHGYGHGYGHGHGHGQASLVLYFHPSCAHCKKMMPEWHRLEAHHKNGLGKKINIKKVNAKLDPKAAAVAGVRGFPTVVLSKDGKDKVYTGPRKAEAIEAFINSN